MRTARRSARAALGAATAALLLAGCGLQPSTPRPRHTFFVGVDTSGSFRDKGKYDDAMTFLAWYIYGHLHALGGLDQPRELFVAAVGGKGADEPKAFHPIQDFEGKTVQEIDHDLRTWFPSKDSLTDFNPFFRQVARIVKERNLVLAPVTVTLITDGEPDFPVAKAGSNGDAKLYKRIDLSPLEYLSRRMSVRLAYVSPTVGKRWHDLVPRQRVRLWTVDAEVMKGWRSQIDPGAPDEQERLWAWIQHNVDFRVRSAGI